MEDIIELKNQVEDFISVKKYTELKALLSSMNPTDIAELLEELSADKYPLIFRLLPKEAAAEVFAGTDSETQKLLIDSFSDAELGAILDELYFDDTADIIEEMPASVVSRILKNASPHMREEVNRLLRYPHDSAGSIMTTEYVGLKKEMTVDEALNHIRKVAIDSETVYTCYVTDSNRHLIGIVSAKTLLISPLTEVIGTIMETHPVSAKTTEPREEVARTFDKYGFLALPVVDGEERLVGIVTVDDAISVLREETEEDFAKMAAITPTEKTYFHTSVGETWKARIPWLLLLMISATFTGMIITAFEDALAAVAALTSFIPMLMDTGGNSGSQASVTIIRGLSLGEIRYRDIFRVIWKECRVAILCGVTLAAGTFIKILLIDNLLMGRAISVPVTAIVCLTLLITVLSAKLIGCILPILAKRLGFDPAVMASPFITTAVDAISLAVYFTMAKLILGI